MKEERKNTLEVMIVFGSIALLVVYMLIMEFKLIDLFYLITVVTFMIKFLLIRRN